MRLPKKLNPETNIAVRSVLYAIGLGGLLHFCVLLIVAFKEHNAIWFNPLFAIDLEKVIPGMQNNWLTFFGGWLGLGLSAWFIAKLIRGSNSSGD